jgi:hypothetical protein
VTKTLFTLLLSCALATALVAQSPGRAHDYVKSMTAKLGLTAERQTQAATIFGNAHSTESTLRARLRTAHQVGIQQLSATVGNLEQLQRQRPARFRGGQ